MNRGGSVRRRLLLTVLAVALAAPAAALGPPEYESPRYDVEERVGREPNIGQKAFDLVILRPFAFAQLLVSGVVFLPSYPVSLLVGGGDDVVDICIKRPVERTFQRPLGRL